MSIITLTTDLGTKDSYLASLKASIFSEINDVNLLEVGILIIKLDKDKS